MGRGKSRELLPNNVFKMAPDFRGKLGQVIALKNIKQGGGTFSSKRRGCFLSFRATVSKGE